MKATVVGFESGNIHDDKEPRVVIQFAPTGRYEPAPRITLRVSDTDLSEAKIDDVLEVTFIGTGGK